MPQIQKIIAALEKRFGAEVRPDRDPLDVLVRGILSQNTTDSNSKRAFDSLIKTFGGWEAVRAAPLPALEKAVRCSGLARQKAASIHAALSWLNARGGYNLDFLNGLPIKQAQEELTAIKGVGIKTARLVLLFGLGRPAFVVDTHVLRTGERLGLLDARCGRVRAHAIMSELIPPQKTYSVHMNMIKLGREICRPKRPLCRECPVARYCLHPGLC